jgi:hypothetical protein
MQKRLFQPSPQDVVEKMIRGMDVFRKSTDSKVTHQMMKENRGGVIIPQASDDKNNRKKFAILFVKSNHLQRVGLEVASDGSLTFNESIPDQFNQLWDNYPNLVNELIFIGTAAAASASPTSPKADLEIKNSKSPKSPMSLASTTSQTSDSELSLDSPTNMSSPSSGAGDLSSPQSPTAEDKKGDEKSAEATSPKIRKPVKIRINTMAADKSGDITDSFEFQIHQDASIVVPLQKQNTQLESWYAHPYLAGQLFVELAFKHLYSKQATSEYSRVSFEFLNRDGKKDQVDYYIHTSGDILRPDAEIEKFTHFEEDHLELAKFVLGIKKELMSAVASHKPRK